MRSTPYITDGYRQDYTAKRALISLFECHNETGSIWSHLMPSIVFAVLTMYNVIEFVDGEAVDNDWIHELLIVLYSIASTILCIGSTIFHLFCCVNEEVYKMTSKIDYTGIVIMISVSFWPFMYQFFYCLPFFALFYSACITIIGGLVLAVSWTPALNAPHYTHWRALLFIGMAGFGVVPVPHAIWIIGWHELWPIFWRLSLMGGLYVCGALLYGYQIPERFFPGKLNHGFFTSHFLFHLFSVAAAGVHYWNAQSVVYWRVQNVICNI